MMHLVALAPTFGKGIAVVIAAFILFIGSVYVLLTAIFGLRMGYLVLAISFFGWMIILSAMWTFGQPKVLGVTGLLPNLGPRGTEAHWQVFAAGTGSVESKYAETATFPGQGWLLPNAGSKSSVDTAKTSIQKYLAEQAKEQAAKDGQSVEVDPATFIVQDVEFATSADTHLVGAHAFFTAGGPEITIFAYHDSGNVPVYSFAFLGASLLGFLIHLPFLDKAEKKRKAILTGGTAPPWFGPA
jgi:hypothetical protein